MYYVLFVKAVAENRQATVMSHFVSLLILVTLYIDIPSMFDQYQQPIETNYQNAELVRISSKKRSSQPQLKLIIGGKVTYARSVLSEKEVLDIREQLPVEVIVVLNRVYQFWPNTELFADHVQIDSEIYKDYNQVYKNVMSTKTSIESVVIRLFIILFLTLRIWLKHK